jgi:hypothetical protein
LLQTTIPTIEDDWSIDRFSLLTEHLAGLTDTQGQPLVQVTARDRQADMDGNDPILSHLDRADFDELWLFALDIGDGLSSKDCTGITRFHQQGGGIFTTRDHQDMGVSMCALNTLGGFHYFHSRQLDPDDSRCCADDSYTPSISYPNYHSGRNGDYQTIAPAEPAHELLQKGEGLIEYFPAHPHEGGIGIPDGTTHARVIATGTSQVTDRSFNLVVAGDRISDGNGNTLGRFVAQSTFHHLVDYNWDISKGCPTFVAEAPGDGYQKHPEALNDIKAYVRNLVLWLAPDGLLSR